MRVVAWSSQIRTIFSDPDRMGEGRGRGEEGGSRQHWRQRHEAEDGGGGGSGGLGQASDFAFLFPCRADKMGY